MAACGSSCVNKGNKGNSGLPEQHQRRGRAAVAARAGYSFWIIHNITWFFISASLTLSIYSCLSLLALAGLKFITRILARSLAAMRSSSSPTASAPVSELQSHTHLRRQIR